MRKHCTTWQPCKIFPKRRDAPCPYSNWQPPPRRSKTNATADLSACNGTSAILGQHKACPDRDDSERTRSFTTPSVPLSHDAENTFLTGKKTPPFILGKQLTPVWMHNTKATADVSPCNGVSAICRPAQSLCPDRDDNERTRPVTTPSVRTSQPIYPHFVPLDMAHGAYDAPLT